MEKHNISDWVEAVVSRIRSINKNRQVHSAEAEYGCDFGGQLCKNDFGYGQAEGYDYTPSPNHVKKFCKQHIITPNDYVMDLGCGKGYAMYMLSRYPFGKVTGVEKSEKLAHIATSNMLCVDSKRCEVFTADAIDMASNPVIREIIDLTNYYYLYNPFPANVVSQVLKTIEESYLRKKRTIVMWYAAPDRDCLDAVLKREQDGYWRQVWSKKS